MTLEEERASSRERNRRWREKNRARKREQATKWYVQHKAQASAASKNWKAHNLQKSRESSRRWRLSHPVEAKATVARWMAKNEDRVRSFQGVNRMIRRARVRGALVESVDPLVVFERSSGVCGICGHSVDKNERWHVDHIVPLSKGGLHSYGNTQLSHARCNLSKGSKLVAA